MIVSWYSYLILKINKLRVFTMETTDAVMKRLMTYLFTGLIGISLGVMLLANMIV